MFLPGVVAVLGAEPCEKTRGFQSHALPTPSLWCPLCDRNLSPRGLCQRAFNYHFYYERLTLICPDLSSGALVELISKAWGWLQQHCSVLWVASTQIVPPATWLFLLWYLSSQASPGLQLGFVLFPHHGLILHSLSAVSTVTDAHFPANTLPFGCPVLISVCVSPLRSFYSVRTTTILLLLAFTNTEPLHYPEYHSNFFNF